MKSDSDRITILQRKTKSIAFSIIKVKYVNCKTSIQSIMILKLIPAALLISIFSQSSYGDDDVYNFCVKNKDCAKGKGCLLVKHQLSNTGHFYTAG